MCSIPSKAHQKFMEHQLFFCLAILMMVAVLCVGESRPKALTFVPWGQPCRIKKIGAHLKPHEQCDESKGIVCQNNGRNHGICWCRLEVSQAETLSYDQESKECRAKVGQYCHYINATAFPDDFAALPFYAKCHENAECEQNETCVCKEHFRPSRDLSQCNFSSSTTANINSVLAFLMLPVVVLLQIPAKV